MKHAENGHKMKIYIASSVVNDATCYSKVDKMPSMEPSSQSSCLDMESVMMRDARMHLFLVYTKEMAK